jgi:ferritin-like metal-binding protein YciE
MKTSKSGARAKGSRSNTNTSSQQASYGLEKSKLHKLFEDGLRDIYWAEKALTTALPQMSGKATSEDLVMAIEKHISETEGHVLKVEKIFKLLGKTARGKKCEAMQGLIDEGKSIMKATDEGAMRDAGIIAAAQKVEHYEIASYGTLTTYAEILGLTEIAMITGEILQEEKTADIALSEVAGSINLDASEEDEAE